MIEWIVTSSALILLVLLLRVVIKDRVSPRLRYALWALVLLRLLIPGTLWESRASVMTPVAAQEARLAVPSERIPVFAAPFAPDSDPYLDSVKAEVIDPSAMGQSFLDPDLYTLPEEEKTADWTACLMGTWLMGVAAAGAFLVIVNLKFALTLKRKRQPAGEYRGRAVYAADGLSTPCLFGLFRPGIYLTPGLDEAEIPHVLAHEYIHFCQWDHLWAALRGVCLALHWYNPLVWLAAYLSRRDCELSCDEGAVRLLGEESRADYGRTLVGLVARRTTAADLACCATTMTGGKSALKERIAILVKHPRTTAAMAVLVAAACAVFAVCTFTGAANAEEPDGPVSPIQTEADPKEEQPPEEPALPALEDLPTRVVSPGTPEAEADIWLAAELPEDDIAVYYDHTSGAGYLRYGDALQALDISLVTMPQMLLPELHFEDLDGDGEKELVISYNVLHGTGASVDELAVYEWDGRQWAGYWSTAAKTVIDDFALDRTLTVFRDKGAAEVSYLDNTVTVDMNAVYKEQGWHADTPHSCTLSELNYRYDFHRSGQIFLHIYGAVQADGYPTYENNILYTCSVIYHEDGTFTVSDEGLTTWYPYFALTPAFREILLDYIHERQETVGGDISADRFAICDVNGDGKDELITQTNYAIMAGQVEVVYDENGNELLAEYPLMTYYDNGYAVAGWSHNQGVAGDKLWPYTLLRYDEDAGRYVRVAAVDGWDKSIRDTYLSYDETVIPFPDDVDKDGDGFVYYIMEEEGGYAPVYGEPMDYAEYAQWVAQYLGANVVHVSKYSLSEENIALIEQN